MKKIIKNLVYGLIVGAGAIFASCSTTDEIMDSIPYDRVLTPQKFDATVVRTSGTDVTFTWLAVSNADKYILEVFNAIELSGGDSETYSVDPADYEGATPVWSSEDIKSDEIPVTVGFDVDKTYFARVRGISSKVENSGWVYLEKVFSTYPVRPSLNPVVVTRTTSEITIAWDDAEDKADLSTFEIVPVSADDVEATVITVTSADIEACTKSFSGLNAGTEYKITLIYGKGGERGSVAAWTRPDMGQVVKVSTVQDIYKNINGATGEVRLEIAYNDGAEYNFAEVLGDPETGSVKSLSVGCDLYLFGETTVDGKKPTLSRVEFALNGTSKALHIEDLVLDGKKTIGATVSVTADSNLDAVEFINCEMFDYTKGIYSVSDKVVANAAKILYKGVYAHDINADGAVAGDFIDIRCGNNPDVEILNSTFSFCARTFLRISDNAKGGKVTVNNVTFNSVTATTTNSNNSGVFHLRETTEISEVYMNNCLFLNMVHDNDKGKGKDGWIRLARNNATQNFVPACVNNYFYNVSEEFFTTQAFVPQTGEHIAPSNEIMAPPANWTAIEEDPCAKSDIGKLYLKNGKIAENRVGDPRWWSATEPIIIRATELETVTETTEWDFTAKAKFETENISENTIIENIRIYAPAEVISGTGIKFNTASTVSATGRPSASALGFKADGYGSVTVLTENGGYNASVHVVVGSDRITLPADGKAHKAVFGDLVGENEIFVITGSPVTIVSVTWTAEDVEAEDTKTALATPKVSLDPASISAGNSKNETVTVSWEPVANAAYYIVTFDGAQVGDKVKDTATTLSASMLAALVEGDYKVEVTAYPVETSTKYSASATGWASLVVKGSNGERWVFSDDAWTAQSSSLTTKGATTTVNGLTVSNDNSGGPKYDTAKGYLDTNSKSSPKPGMLRFEFAVPAGKWNVVVDAAEGGTDAGLQPTINVQVGDAVQTQNVALGAARTNYIFTIEVEEDTTVAVYGEYRLHYYGLSYQAINGWKFSDDAWKAQSSSLTTKGATTTVNGLTVSNDNSGGPKYSNNEYLDTNAASSPKPGMLRFEFTLPAGDWNLIVDAKEGGTNAGLQPTINVVAGDAETPLTQNVALGAARANYVFPVSLDAETKIAIYGEYRLHYYGIYYSGFEK